MTESHFCTCGHAKQDHKNDGIQFSNTRVSINRNTECEGPYCNCKKYELDKIQ